MGRMKDTIIASEVEEATRYEPTMSIRVDPHPVRAMYECPECGEYLREEITVTRLLTPTHSPFRPRPIKATMWRKCGCGFSRKIATR